jgi:hypothetical protein
MKARENMKAIGNSKAAMKAINDNRIEENSEENMACINESSNQSL